MPHLSPMIWLFAPLMFLFILTPMIMSSLWWSQSPNFPNIKTQTTFSINNNWNWQ